MNVLVASDDPSEAELIRVFLEARGQSVTVVDSYEAAMSLILEQLPDLIISSMNLVDKSGYDLLGDLCKAQRTKEIPTIMILSDINDDKSVLQAQVVLTDLILCRPFNMDDNYKHISDTLRRFQESMPYFERP